MLQKDKTQWTTFRRRYIPAVWPLIAIWSWPVEKVLGIPRKATINVWDKGWYSAIWDKQGVEEMGKYAFGILQKNISSLHQIREKGVSTGEETVHYCKSFAENLESAQLTDYITFLEGMEKRYNQMIENTMVYYLFINDLLELKIRKVLSSFSRKAQQEIMNVMSIPTVPLYSKREEVEFEGLYRLYRKEGLSSPQTKKEIRNFSQKWIWFPYEYVGDDIFDEQAVQNKLKEFVPEKNKVENISEVRRKCIQKYNLSSEVVDIFKILQITTLMQDDRKRYNSEVSYYVNQVVMRHFAKKLNVPVEQLRYADLTALQEHAHSQDKKKFTKKLAQRTLFTVASQVMDKTIFYDADEGKKHLAHLGISLEPMEENKTEIKGSVANPGKAQGAARIIVKPKNATFKQGDILITSMTTPDFISLMKKAGAIVTDEGGITCHAAIISRELKKPCIIGTKVATKVFRDGDMVEVDANKGTVRKL